MGRSPDSFVDCTSLPSFGDICNKLLWEVWAVALHLDKQGYLGGRPLYSDFGGGRHRIHFFWGHPRLDFQYIKQCLDLPGEFLPVGDAQNAPSSFHHMGVPICVDWYSSQVSRLLTEGSTDGFSSSVAEHSSPGLWKLTLLIGCPI